MQYMQTLLAKLIEHNNWANLELLRFCAALDDEQLDARPPAAGDWSVRHTLVHLVQSQLGYLSLLTLPPAARGGPPLEFGELEAAATRSGAALLALCTDGQPAAGRITTLDGYLVEPWVVVVQVVNHANDHRRQVATTLRALGVSPPRLDGWAFGEATNALVPIDGKPSED